MALKILLADDSMTAQNMGKKILTEAGYEVVAVSNGAQAVKKIASEKPELVVLDVFMPGYTGVEVCERLRKAQETAHIPVLLTVGKMEPFKAEEGTRAGADGLVVKPFEASDLLAAIKKLEEKLASAAPEPEIEATVKLPVEEFQDASYEEWKVSAPETPAEEVGAAAPAAIAVPDEMASAPAFGMESLEETAPPPPPSMADTQPVEPPPAARTTEPITPPDLRPTEPITPPAEVFAEPAARTTAEMPAPLQAAAGAAAAPVLAEEAPASAPEIEFTSQRIEHEVEHAPTPGFEPTVSQEQISAPTGRDSLLVTDTDELSHFATKFGVEGAEPIPVGVAAEMPGLYADSQAPAAEAPAAVEGSADADFEARVAAAMAGYEEAPTATIEVPAPEAPAAVAPPAPEPAPVEAAPEPVAEPEPAPAEEHVGMGMETASFIAQMQKAVEDLPVDTTPHVEAAAEPVAAPPPAPAPAPAPENVPDHALAAAMAAAVGAAVEPQVVAAVAPAAEGTQKIDPTLIADIVSRVVERMKPDLAAEIARELESKLRK